MSAVIRLGSSVAVELRPTCQNGADKTVVRLARLSGRHLATSALRPRARLHGDFGRLTTTSRLPSSGDKSRFAVSLQMLDHLCRWWRDTNLPNSQLESKVKSFRRGVESDIQLSDLPTAPTATRV